MMNDTKEELESGHLTFSKSGFDRAINILVGIFAILLGIYLTVVGITVGGFGGPLVVLLYLILGPLSLIFGISLLRKKEVVENKQPKVNLARALLIAIAILIVAFYLLRNARF